MAIRLHPLHHLPVISNGSSGAPEKNWNDVWGYDLVTFWKLPNLTDRDLPHLDLPTSEKLANQGRINPRHCNDRRNLTQESKQNHNITPRILFNEISPIVTMTFTSSKYVYCQIADSHYKISNFSHF